MSDTVTGPAPLTEVQWLRQRVEYLEARLAGQESAPEHLPPPADVAVPDSVTEAIRARADRGSATERQLATEAKRLLDEGVDADVVAKMILDGEQPNL